MIKYFFSPLLMLLLSTGFTQAQDMTIVDAIEKASHQRMLTQKMLSCYLRLGSNVEKESAKGEMDESAAKFEELMIELLDFTPNQQVVNAIEKAQASWRVYSLKLLSYPNKTMGSVLLNLSGKVIKEYDGLLQLLESQAQMEKAKLINLAGRQAMLSQKIEVLYLALNWGFTNKEIYMNLEVTNEEFEEAHELLSAAEISTPKIMTQLKSTDENWKFVNSKFIDTKSPALIINTTSLITREFMDIAKQYGEHTELPIVDDN